MHVKCVELSCHFKNSFVLMQNKNICINTHKKSARVNRAYANSASGWDFFLPLTIAEKDVDFIHTRPTRLIRS